MSLASSSSLILDQDDLPPTSNDTDVLSDDVGSKPMLLLQADSPLIISGLSIVDNGRNLVKEVDTSQPFEPTEIILNLILTATVHHNITINKQAVPQNNCSETCTKSNCSQECIKYFVDVIGWENVLKYVNQSDDSTTNKSLVSFSNKYNIDKYVDEPNENRSGAVINNNEIVSNILRKTDEEEVAKKSRRGEVKNGDGRPCSGATCKTVRSKRDMNLEKFSPSLSLIKSIVGNGKVDTFVAETSTNPKHLQNDKHIRADRHSNPLARDVMTRLRNDYCFHPEYIIFTWVLCLIALATALKLYYLIKTFLAIIMVALYTILILVPFDLVFNDFISNGDLER